jgi:DNA-binding winged helix-turn-helix (wHTH) protein
MPDKGIYVFGNFRLDAGERALFYEGKLVSLTPKALDTLCVLVSRAGHVVSKDELMQAVWPDTFVEDGNLSVNIFALRKALGEGTNGHLFIETVPRRGFRFVAPVELEENGPEGLAIQTRTRMRVVTEEIEETHPEPPETIPPMPVPGEGLPALPAPRGVRAVWPALAAGIAALALLVVGTGWWLANRPGAPVRVSLVRDQLTAWDAKGRVAWEYTLPEPAEIQPVQGSEAVTFQDLTGDGHLELLMLVNPLPRMPAAASSPSYNSVLFKRTVLYCFSNRGKLLWAYSPDAVKLPFNGRVFEGPWRALAMLFTPREQGKYIWISFVHNTWWPNFVMRIDARGGATMAYLNSGSLGSLAYVRNTSGGYVIAAGTNNGYGSAVVVIIGENDPPSVSPQIAGTPYGYDQWAGGPYLLYVLPPSELFRMSGESFHGVAAVQVSGHRIQVQTNEGKDIITGPGNGPYLLGFYEFSTDFKLLSASLSDTYWNAHRRLEQEGKIHHTAEQCPDRKIASRVRLWLTNRGWTSPELPTVQAPN